MSFSYFESIMMIGRILFQYNLFGYYEIADVIACCVMLLGFIISSYSGSHVSVEFLSICKNKTYRKIINFFNTGLFIIMCSLIFLSVMKTGYKDFIEQNLTFMYSIPLWTIDLAICASMITTIITILFKFKQKQYGILST